MNPRVFVVQDQPSMNISPALEYGEIVMMLDPGDHAFNPTRMINALRTIVEERNFEVSDYLLLIGDPVAIGCAMAITDQWLQANWDQPIDEGSAGPKLKVLKWDRQNRRYLPIELGLASE